MICLVLVMLKQCIPELVMSTDLLSFEHPSVLLFCFLLQVPVTIGINVTTSQNGNIILPTNFAGYSHPMVIERAVIYLALFPIIVIIGIFGNILTLIVLFRGKETSTTVIYLKNLAAVDLFTLTIKAACAVCVWWQIFWPDEYIIWKVNAFTLSQLSHCSEKISKYTTLAIVFERMVAVTWPLKVKDICTRLRTTVAVVVIYVILISVSLPLLIDAFVYFYNTATHIKDNLTPLSEGHQYFKARVRKHNVLLITFLINRVVDFLPIPIIIIGNIMIISGLRKRDIVKCVSEARNQQRKRQERKVTKLCLIVSMTFLCLCCPLDVNVFLLFIQTLKVDSSTQFTIEILDTLALINSAVNFIIYAALNRNYRQGYVSILTCFKREPDLRLPISIERTHTKKIPTISDE